MHCSWLSRKVTLCLSNQTGVHGRMECPPRAQVDSWRTSKFISDPTFHEEHRRPLHRPPSPKLVEGVTLSGPLVYADDRLGVATMRLAAARATRAASGERVATAVAIAPWASKCSSSAMRAGFGSPASLAVCRR